MNFRSLALVALGVVFAPPSLPASAEVPDDTIRIAILPVRVHSSASRDYLRAGLVERVTPDQLLRDPIEVGKDETKPAEEDMSTTNTNGTFATKFQNHPPAPRRL